MLVNKLKTTGLALLLVLFLLPQLSQSEAAIENISIQQAKQLYDDGALFIDTRSYIERKFGIIKGAIAIKKSEIVKKQYLLPKDKNKVIVTYCARGIRAGAVANHLYQLGYQHVYVIYDAGFGAWNRAGFPVE